MPLFSETKSKIFGDLLVDIVDNTNITKTSIGSKTRAIAEALSGKLGQMYRKFDLNIAQAFVVGAEGIYLDFLGDMVGLGRLGQETATVTSSERNQKFYVESGTFGDINNNSSILLTAGSVVSTGEAGTGILYTIPYNVIIAADLSEIYVAVQAVRAGTESNIGAKQLIYHNFTGYTDSSNDTLKTINEAEVIRGQDGEIDTNYRFRISRQVTAAEKANLTSVRLAVLTVPGVADLVMVPFFRGVGTYDILIKAVTSIVPVGLLAAVDESVSNVSALGIVQNIRAPIEIGVSLVGVLTLRKRLSVTEESNIISAVTGNVTDYINSLDIGEDFIINEVIERVMATSSEIKNLGSAIEPFVSKYIYRPTKLEDNKIRNILVGDYSAEEDERVIVETQYGGQTPILITIKQ